MQFILILLFFSNNYPTLKSIPCFVLKVAETEASLMVAHFNQIYLITIVNLDDSQITDGILIIKELHLS